MYSEFSFGWITIFIFASSAVACSVILKYWHQQNTVSIRAGDLGAVQSAHTTPTPRVGGLAFGTALVMALAFAPPPYREEYFLFAFSILPVFMIGLAEDLGFHMSARRRLLAAAVSSILVIATLDLWVMRLDIPGSDVLLGITPIGIVFTVVATAGICNAFNLIDGLNGLSSGIGIMTASGLAAVAKFSGDAALFQLNIMLVAALLGFFIFNFPWGRLFLGDAGAYSLGFILAWLAVAIVARSSDVAAWSILLIFFWPVADTMLAIFRRRAAGLRSDQPDRLHFHQLMMRALEIHWLGRKRRSLANPLATLIMLPFIAAPIIVGVLLWNEPFWSFLSVVGFSVLFFKSYQLGMRIAQRG